MERFIADLVKTYESGAIDRREFCKTVALAASVYAAGDAAQAQAPRGFKMIGGELLAQVRFHRGDIGVEPVEVDAAADLELGANGVVFEVGGEQAGRQHFGHTKLVEKLDLAVV